MTMHTPGSNAVVFEWSAGTMAIEMKNYSALLKITFPPLAPGGEVGEYTVRMEASEIE